MERVPASIQTTPMVVVGFGEHTDNAHVVLEALSKLFSVPK